MINIKKFEEKISFKFNDKSLIPNLLTHKSFSKANNNEMLEFLGDRVLGLVLSKKLLELYPTETVGNLDKRFAFLVNKNSCLKISKKLNIEKFLILGDTYKNKKKVEDKILSDVIEALIGAIFLDSGYSITEKFILNLWKTELKINTKTIVDSKTQLQEYSLKTYKKLPVYKILKLQGPKHSPFYLVGVKITSFKQHTGNGKSIKIAQQNAAKNLLMSIR